MGLIQSVPDDEIAAEFAASLAPDDEHREVLERRARRGIAPVAPAGGAWSSGPLERRRPGDPRNLREAAERVRPVALAREHTLPVAPALAALLPGGLPRGSTVSVGTGADPRAAGAPVGATSLALALAAAPSQAGSWVALVGVPALGLAAAAELGVALERVAVIEAPPADTWAVVLGALVGAFDLVLFGPPGAETRALDDGSPDGRSPAGRSSSGWSSADRSDRSDRSTAGGPGRVPAADLRRLAARARERGSVLVHLDTPAASRSAAAPGATSGRGPTSGVASAARARTWARALDLDLRFSVGDARWHGLGDGHGHVRGRQVTVELTGRRQAARPQRADLWLLDPDGRLRVVEPERAPVVVHPRARPVVGPTVAPAPAVATSGDAAFAGADIDDLVRARRERLRQLARAPLPEAPGAVTAPPARPSAAGAGPGPGAPAGPAWSDAG